MLSIEEIEKEINLGNFEYVIEKCNEYLNLNSDLAFLYNYRGLCKNNLGLYEEAIKDFDISIELNKKFKNSPTAINKDLADAYYYKGLAKNNLREYKEAIDNFNETLKCNRSYWLVVNYNIGICKINLGEYEDAINYFDNINQIKYYNETEKKEESYYIKIYEYHMSTFCNKAFAKLLSGKNVYFEDFINYNKFFIPNNNHIIYIVS
ncbi:tetratricopeptide repeat protein, partial [Brachyspira aalborgi]